MAYAETTKVPVAQTRAEIEKLLKAAKATRVVTIDDPLEATVMCMLAGRLIKILVPIAGNASDQIRRARWRALLLTIKAKREAVESGIETVEQAFLSHVVLPDGRTMGEWAEPALQLAYDRGQMPADPLRLPAPRADGGSHG
ncbi:hypothetical protein MEX01_48780 [Methylorubrum extorquens]|uniref:hypothetical protein n=1 Tax=Methylorubrum extorquens TaxID=408 RepID=UPI001172A8BB|nr:hypothetical protein [Methylorubrum extorquens]GEL44287.1 hypothetical protein MEX01_48780 [Methylorubrum extorquens]